MDKGWTWIHTSCLQFCRENGRIGNHGQNPTCQTPFWKGRYAYGLLIGICLLLAATGCNNNTIRHPASESSTDSSTTIFGRLSQFIQLGSTEETIAYKLPVGPYFATIDGEVLMERPAYLDTVITEIESGVVRDDLLVSIELCNVVDENIFYIESCTDYEGALYEHQLEARLHEGAYRVDGFTWERSGNWAGTLTIVAPTTGDVERVPIFPYVYPTRPPSTNLFELVSVVLPFVVIGLFLAGAGIWGGRFVVIANKQS
ncbi:MAG: hypothetical protein AAF702_35480 [Chloroflexota bacterium]